jgi:hypothetical protein
VILSFAASRFAMVRPGKNDSTAASRSRIPSSAAMAIGVVITLFGDGGGVVGNRAVVRVETGVEDRLSVPDDQQAVNVDLLIPRREKRISEPA